MTSCSLETEAHARIYLDYLISDPYRLADSMQNPALENSPPTLAEEIITSDILQCNHVFSQPEVMIIRSSGLLLVLGDYRLYEENMYIMI